MLAQERALSREVALMGDRFAVWATRDEEEDDIDVSFTSNVNGSHRGGGGGGSGGGGGRGSKVRSRPESAPSTPGYGGAGGGAGGAGGASMVEIEALKRQINQLDDTIGRDGGSNGGWSQRDHDTFLRLWTHEFGPAATNAVALSKISADDMRQHCEVSTQ